jgi:hypothetical protein
VGGAINGNVADNDHVLGKRRTDAAHHGADARGEFRHRERLGHVVVRADIEAADAVALFGARGQHDDRQVARRSLRAQAAGDFNARKLGQHPVEQDDVRLAFLDQQERLFAVSRGCNLIAFLDEVVAEQLDERASSSTISA